LDEWKHKDPIARLVGSLKEQGVLTEDAWQKMDTDILQDIEDAVTFAKDSPFPELDTAVEDVFAD
jgi:pyruvate dehydrogenase E1 component alpha subunit